MSDLTLSLRDAPITALDLSPLTPSSLAGKSRDAIARLQLADGGRRVRLDKLFELDGDAGIAADGKLVLRGVNGACIRAGANMASGELDLRGSCGALAGAGMSGGTLRISGDVGDDLGAGLRGGVIHVRGSAGDRVGGPLAGSVRGMNEGCIVIDGNAGAAVGERMRRGVILVAGDTGPLTGARMIAGTIIVLGQAGNDCGHGMRRGTLLLTKPPARPPAGFSPCGEYEPGFLRMLASYLKPLHRRHAARVATVRQVLRLSGDGAHGGLGEILIASGSGR